MGKRERKSAAELAAVKAANEIIRVAQLKSAWEAAAPALDSKLSETNTLTTPQHFSFNTVIFEPLFTEGLSVGERSLYQYFNYRAWQKKNLILRCAVPFLSTNTGISESAIKRHLQRLLDLNLIRCVKIDHKKGNRYLIEPLLLGQHYWKSLPLANLNSSELFKMVQNGPTQILSEIRKSVQNRPTDGAKKTVLAQLARRKSVQNGPQIYLLYSLLIDDAQRHSLPIDSAGGEEGLGQRSPNGQDHTEGGTSDKGVGLPADSIAARCRAQIEAKHAELVRQEAKQKAERLVR